MSDPRPCPRAIRELFHGLDFYTPRERRRVARADSGPGRRFARRVGLRRPAPGTISYLEEFLLFSCPKLRRRHVRMISDRPGHLRIELPYKHVDDARLALALNRNVFPATVLFEVGVAGAPRELYREQFYDFTAWAMLPERVKQARAERRETPIDFTLVPYDHDRWIFNVLPKVSWLAPLDGEPFKPLPIEEFVAERRLYDSPVLGWRGYVFALREEHETKLVPMMRAAEAAIEFFVRLADLLATRGLRRETNTRRGRSPTAA